MKRIYRTRHLARIIGAPNGALAEWRRRGMPCHYSQDAGRDSVRYWYDLATVYRWLFENGKCIDHASRYMDRIANELQRKGNHIPGVAADTTGGKTLLVATNKN